MKTPKFAKQRVNVNGLWRATVVSQGDTLPAERLNHRIMNECRLDRRTMDRLLAVIHEYVEDELAAGNTINLFDMVRLTTRLQVDRPSVRSEAEADAMVASLTQADIHCRIDAHVPCTYQRRFLSSVQCKRLRAPRPGRKE